MESCKTNGGLFCFSTNRKRFFTRNFQHEVTRNRMRELLRRKRRERERALRVLGADADVSAEESHHNGFADTGSICGSVGRSPLVRSGSATPTEENTPTIRVRRTK